MPIRPVPSALLTLLLVFPASTDAATYFVAKDGSDNNSGQSEGDAFLTLTRGVEALAAGDTLLVGPGRYHEQVLIEKSGEPDMPIAVKVQYPGRAELIGSVRLTCWSPVKGYDQAFRAPLAQTTRLVYEKDTDTEYTEVASLRILERTAGSFHYDVQGEALFVHPSDDQGMQHHVVDACVLDYGLVSLTTDPQHLHAPRRVGLVIDGLVVRDYQKNGIFIHNADYCAIRNCIVHHCRRGIFTESAYHSRIVGCEAFACADRFNREMGNIGMMSYAFHCELLDNLSYSTRQHGVRFYGAHYGCVMRGNLAYGCHIGIHVKGRPFSFEKAARYARFSDVGEPKIVADVPPVLFEHNVTHQNIGTGLIPKHSFFRHNTGVNVLSASALESQSNIELAVDQVPQAGFVDPAWHDLRLQADSPHRRAGHEGETNGAYPYFDEVFFVSPAGNDENAGTSIATAWRTLTHATASLEAGQTLYLLPGVYTNPLRLNGLRATGRPTIVRAHGKGEVFLDGKGKNSLAVEIVGCRTVKVQGLRLRNTTKHALLIRDSDDVHVSENELFDNRGDAILVAGAAAGVRMIGNTVVFNAGRGITVSAEAPDAWIVGNIVRDNASQINVAPGPPDRLYCDLNNLGGTGCIGIAAETSHASLGAWQSATGLDENSIDVAPGFVDPNRRDLTLERTSLCRGRGYLGRPIGAGRVKEPSGKALSFKHVRVVATQTTSADIQWSLQGGRGTMIVAYGMDPTDLEHVIVHDTGHFYLTHHSTTLRGLEPGTLYYFRVGSRRMLDGEEPFHSYRYAWPERTPAGEAEFYKTLRKADTFDTRVYTCATRMRDVVSSRVYHVSANGGDGALGTEAYPFHRIGQATDIALPGDRIVVHGGTYYETIRPLRSGLPDHPITIEAARGERVEINGHRELIPIGVDLLHRHHVVIRGFHFFGQTEYGSARGRSGHIFAVDASDIRVEQCVFDGRMNYINSLNLYRSKRIVIHNNIFVSHHVPMLCTDNEDLIITRNTYLGPTIYKLYGPRNRNLALRSNLFGEVLFPKKKLQYKLSLGGVDGIDMDYNCYYFDPKNDQRRMVDYIPAGVDLAKVTSLPELQKPGDKITRWGIKGDLTVWRETFGQDRHGMIADPEWANPELITELRTRPRGWPNRFFEYKPFSREDLRLTEDSPCRGAGEGGADIGADYTY